MALHQPPRPLLAHLLIALYSISFFTLGHEAKLQGEASDVSGRARAWRARDLQQGIASQPTSGPASDPEIPLAGLDEPCRTGGNVKPIYCQPGLYCDAPPNLPSYPGDPNWNPDQSSNGTCRALNDTVGLGEPCREGGNIKPVRCSPGLYCAVSSNNSVAPTPTTAPCTALGFWASEGGPATAPPPHADWSINGTCQPVTDPFPWRCNETDPCGNSTEDCVVGIGQTCRSGGNIRPIHCQPGLVCQPVAPDQSSFGGPGIQHDDYAQFGTCVPDNGTTVNSTGAEGQPCTVDTAGNQSIPCQPGLTCDTSGYTAGFPGEDLPMMASAMMSSGAAPPSSWGVGVGVCRGSGGLGKECFAGGALQDKPNGTSTDWSWECASGLICLVLDPGAFANGGGCNKTVGPLPGPTDGSEPDAHPVKSDTSGQGSSGVMCPLSWTTGPRPRLVGYCLNATSVSPGNTTGVPGTEGSQCSLGASSSSSAAATPAAAAPAAAPAPAAAGGCATGLTCIANASAAAGTTSNSSSNGSSSSSSTALRAASVLTHGVCANATQLLSLINLAAPSTPSNGQENDSKNTTSSPATTSGAPGAGASTSATNGQPGSLCIPYARALVAVLALLLFL